MPGLAGASHRGRGRIAAGVVAAAIVALFPGSARAGLVYVEPGIDGSGQVLRFEPSAGEASELVVDLDGVAGVYTLTESGWRNSLTAGSGCTQVTGQQVRCPVMASRYRSLLELGDAGDRVEINGPSEDVLRGDDGMDWLAAGEGADTLVGGQSSDSVRGDSGDDVLPADPGPDSVAGGLGDDLADYSSRDEPMCILLAERYGGSPECNSEDTFHGDVERAIGGSSADEIYAPHIPSTIEGGPGDDVLHAGGAPVVLLGGAGDDVLTDGARYRHDVFDGGEGSDLVSYRSHPAGVVVDLARGVGGGHEEDDVLRSIENAEGSDELDRLRGDDGPNRLDARVYGAGGLLIERVEGGAGDDHLDGGVLAGGPGDDVLGGDGRTVVIDYSDSPGPVVVDLTDDLPDGAVASGERDRIGPRVKEVRGSRFDDHLRADAVVRGGGGADEIWAVDSGPFPDMMYGDAGDDRLFASSDGSSLDGGDGADRLVGLGWLSGGPGPDTLLGSAGRDSIDGGTGDDLIDGRLGSDSLTGGPGSDLVDYSDRSGQVTAYLNEPSTWNGERDAGERDELEEIENFLGGSGPDLVWGSVLPNRITGGDGDDEIHGGAGWDELDGGSGADSLLGDDGADTLRGGDGDDDLDGGGRLGVDRLDGGDGSDTALYSARTEPVYVNLASPDDDGAEGEVDVLTAVENATGGSGDDVLEGDGRGNRLDGGAGQDEITGNLGVDRLFGDDGDDSLFSADGERDEDVCGAGIDRVAADDADTAAADCERVVRDAPTRAQGPTGDAAASGPGELPGESPATPAAAPSAAQGPPAEFDAGPERRVSHMGSDGDVAFAAGEPSVAYDPHRDRYLVVWHGNERPEGGYEIWGRLLSGDGEPAGDQFQISQTRPDDPDHLSLAPAAAYNERTGEFLVTWSVHLDAIVPLGLGTSVRAQRLDGAGREVGPDDFEVSGSPGYRPDVAVDSATGQYLLVWVGARSEVFGQRLDPLGRAIGEDDVQISNDDAMGGFGFRASSADAAFNPRAGEFIVVWNGSPEAGWPGDGSAVYGQRLSRQGYEVGPEDFQVADSASEAFSPTVAYNPRSDEYLVVWHGRPREDDNPHRRDVIAQRVSPEGEEIGHDDQRVSRSDLAHADRLYGAVFPALAVNPASGDYVIAWRGGPASSGWPRRAAEIFVQRLTAAGKQFGRDDFRIASTGPRPNGRHDSVFPAVAYGGPSHAFLVAWNGDHYQGGSVDAEFEISGRRLGHYAGDPPEGDPGADRDAPETVVASAPPKVWPRRFASFELESSEGGSRFECRVDKGAWSACEARAEVADLPDGVHTFEARAIDASGNTDLQPAAHSWRVDTQAPFAWITDAPHGPTSDREATFVYSASSDDTWEYHFVFECRLDNRDWERCARPQQTYLGLSEGAHKFRVRATDTAGNVSRPAVHEWVIEGSRVAIVDAPERVTSNRDATFQLQGLPPGGRFLCALDHEGARPCDSTVAYRDLPEGPHRFSVHDEEGLELGAEWSWTVDDQPPQTIIVEGPTLYSGVVLLRDGRVSFEIASNEDATRECRLDGAAWERCGYVTTYNGLSTGDHTFEARTIDDAGNVDPTPASVEFRVDREPPNSTIESGPSGTTSAADATFTFSTDEDAELQCQLDGGQWDRCQSPKTYQDLPDGTHTFRVRAVDPAENTERSPARRTWRIDTHAPATRIHSAPADVTEDRNARFELGASEPSTFRCRLDGGEWRACEDEVTYANLGDGEHRFEARAIDQAGQEDPTPAHRQWWIGEPPPGPETFVESGPPAITREVDAVFRFGASVPGSSFICSVDGSGWAGCPADLVLRELAEGLHRLEVRALEEQNDDTPAVYEWRVDTTPPETIITEVPALPDSTATMRFSASEAGATFACRLDEGAWHECTSPQTYSGLASGRHSFGVFATDVAGNADPTAATLELIASGAPPRSPGASPSPTNPDIRVGVLSTLRFAGARLTALGSRRLVRRRAVLLPLAPLDVGNVVVTLRHRKRRQVVARGSAPASAAGTKVRVRLTRAGLRLLKAQPRVRLALRVAFIPPSGTATGESTVVRVSAKGTRHWLRR